jgi:hypothetical protein
MAVPNLPALTAIGPEEVIVGQWEFALQVQHLGFDRMVTRAVLTPQRLVGASIMVGPTATSKLSMTFGRHTQQEQASAQKMSGAWQVTLRAELAKCSRPQIVGPTTLRAFRQPVFYLAVQGGGLVYVVNSPAATEMLGRVVAAWESSHPTPR